jgi:NADH-quinone oxidoreductase subunit E
MLSEHETEEIRQAAEGYPNRRAAVPDALLMVQRHHGWVSDEHIHDVAEILGLSEAEVESTATFYSLVFRRPVGRHVILLCDSVSCWLTGYDDLLAHISRLLGVGLGETTPDERFTLLPVACLGACDEAPAMMVDGALYGNLTPRRIEEILDRYA